MVQVGHEVVLTRDWQVFGDQEPNSVNTILQKMTEMDKGTILGDSKKFLQILSFYHS